MSGGVSRSGAARGGTAPVVRLRLAKATCQVLSPRHLPDELGACCGTTNHRGNMPAMTGALCSAAANASRRTRLNGHA
jgi:hypothetical protein